MLEELADADGTLSLGTRESLAAEAFSYTARYDTAIARWFAEKQEDFPPLSCRAYEKVIDLAYGENPHQRAAYYAQVGARMHVLSMVRQLARQGALVQQPARPRLGRGCSSTSSSVPACAIIKHNNPCGAALGGTGREAYERAFACDPQSAFGGVICLNRPVDRALAEAARRAVRRGAVRARATTTTRSSCSSASRTCASSRTTSGAASTSPSATSSG